ncbi:endonuclease I family protein [Pelagibius sp.]|uniref:endonuclease I family protein n=1 Tax=Pelagibius sp. TaxID=1931238 RepID=UPI003BB133B9
MRLFARAAFSIALVLLLPDLAAADQTKIPSYAAAKKTYFYKKLYPAGGWTLYCGARFKGRSGMSIEHIYPASWMKVTAGCKKSDRREDCRKKSNRFNLMEADLHNLYPAVPRINSTRWNHSFGIIRGEERKYSTPSDLSDIGSELKACDFELDTAKGIVEPRKIARGNIARSVFYMHQEYDLPIDKRLGVLLRKWNEADPPNAHETRRNAKIEQLQGTRNPFIDKPSLANNLRFASNEGDLPPIVERVLAGLDKTSEQTAQQRCCKICRKGKACGNSCISRSYTCRQPPGCACNG